MAALTQLHPWACGAPAGRACTGSVTAPFGPGRDTADGTVARAQNAFGAGHPPAQPKSRPAACYRPLPVPGQDSSAGGDELNDTLAVLWPDRKSATYTDYQVLFQRRRYRT